MDKVVQAAAVGAVPITGMAEAAGVLAARTPRSAPAAALAVAVALHLLAARAALAVAAVPPTAVASVAVAVAATALAPAVSAPAVAEIPLMQPAAAAALAPAATFSCSKAARSPSRAAACRLRRLGAATVQGGSGGGTGGSQGANGDALGGALFIQGGNTATFGAAAGQTTLVSNVITDQSGNPSAENFTAGAGSVIINASGTVKFTAHDTYTGGTTIQAGTLELGSGGSIAGTVSFADTGTAETLRFDTGASQLGGSIAGMAIGADSIDLGFHAFAAGDHAVWSQSSANSGTVLLLNSGSTVVASFNLTGTFGPQQFAAASDNNNGTSITVVAQPANAPPPAGTTAAMIMRDGNNGDYEIYDLGNNAILGAGYLGQVGLEWQVAGVGAFNAPNNPDMILRNSNTGAFEIYDISNNAITGNAPMGQVGLEWSVSGFGDFSDADQ